MRKTIGFLTMTACLFAAPSEKDRREAAARLTEASTVFGEILHAGDKGIPQDLVDKAQCAVIVPGLKKGAFFRFTKVRKVVCFVTDAILGISGS